jgi:transcriptional regulator with XRE-family HTH domain
MPTDLRPPRTPFGLFIERQMAEHQPPLSQSTLARRAKVSPASVSRWLREPGRPDADSLRRLAEALDTDYDDLLAAAGYGRPSADIGEALAGLRPQVDPLAAELSAMLDPGSALGDDDRVFLQHMVDRLIDPYRRKMRRRGTTA